MAAALAGADSFCNAGMLSIDEIYSPVQVVIDNEILEYTKRVLQGYEFSSEALSDEIITDVIQNDSTFIEHESTIKNYNKILWMPELFEHYTLDQWKTRESKEVSERARQIAKVKLSEHDFCLATDTQKEIDSIFEHACKHLT